MNTLNWQNATPEQLLLWDIAKLKVAYSSITPFNFSGAIAGSEFLTYTANKLYIGLNVIFSNGYGSATMNRIVLYNEANAVASTLSGAGAYWDGALKYNGSDINVNNIWFSRIVADIYANIYFLGYKLNP